MEKTKTIVGKKNSAARPLALALEQRFMFDAAGVATGTEVAQEVAAKQAADQASESDAATPSDNSSRKDLVLIDANVNERDVLAAGIPDNAEVIYLESGTTLNDIADLLSGYQDIDGLHIISHGGDASLNLSGQTLTASNLVDNQAALGIIGQSLSADGDILLYGCNIGAESDGQVFITDFAEYTNADVAASDDLTGAAALGGDWDLEVSQGELESNVIVNQQAQLAYDNVLMAPVSSGTFDWETATDNGANVTQTVSTVTATVTTPDINGIDSLNAGGFEGSSGVVTFTGAAATSMTITFSQSVNVLSVFTFLADSNSGADASVVFTPTGGSNSVVTEGISQSAGEVVNLNWTNITAITLTAPSEPGGIEAFAIDDIVLGTSNSAPDLGGTPADDTATEDVATAIDLSAYNVSDADGDTVTLTLAVDRGTIASTDGNGITGGVTVSNTGTASMTLQGTAANLNTYLNDTSKITYTTASNDTTTAVLTVTPNDGTVDGTADTVNISITPVNDNPTGSGMPSDVTVTEDTQSNIDFSAISFADVDSASITVTLTASAGTFASPADGAGIGGGVTETLQSATVITLVGSPADINTYLDTASNIQYTAASNVSGGNVATISITANDGNGSGDVSLGTVNVDVTGVNDNPAVATLPAAVTVTEDTQSNIALGATVFSDVDSASITVTLTASAGTFATPADGAGVGGGVTETLQSATVITLVGSPADINTYLDTASNIQYTPAANVSGNAAATITVTMNDGDGSGNVSAGTVNINVTAVNDDPVISLASTTLTVNEDSSNTLIGNHTVSDVDSASLRVTLSATNGTLSIGNSSGLSYVTGNGFANTTMTFTGTVASINSALSTTVFTPTPNYSGNATITITSDDNLAGGGLTDTESISVTVTAVNDDPTSATLPSAVTVTEDTQSNINLGTAVFADIDSASMTVTLTASAGTFASPADGAGVGGGVTETLQSSTVITLVGSPADINTYLDTASNIQYTPASNVSGNAAATITVTMNDGDGSGNVSAGTVNINVTAVNDAPTVSTLPASVTVTEDTQSNIALGAAVFADVDGDNITVTLTASAGTFATPADGAGVGSGVTETLQSSTVITLVGSPADINTYLDTASNIQYTAASNVTGNAAATISVVANDGAGSGNVNLGTVNINVTAVNDNPAVATLPSSVTVTEDTQSNIGLGTTVFSDVDSASITVTLTASAGTFATPADGAGVGGGVTETLQSATVITLVGSPADINTYLDTASNIQYTPASNVSGNAAATITVTMNDGDGSGNVSAGTVNINVTAVNDDPVISLASTTLTVNEDSSNTLIGNHTVSDVDSVSLRVTLSATNGTLSIGNSSGLSYVTGNGFANTTMTFTGTVASINSALSTTVFTPTPNYSGSATISITTDDNLAGGGLTDTENIAVTVTAVNDVPVFSNLDGTPAFTEGGSAQILDANVTVADLELDVLNGGSGNYNGAVLTIARNGGANTNDVFSAAGTLSALTEGVNFSVGGSVLGTVTTNSGGTLVLTFSDASVTPTTALVNSALQQIAYANSSNDPVANVQLNWTLSDGNSGNAQGTGDNPGNGAGSTTVSVTNVNDAPTLTATGGNPTYTENGAAQDLFNTVTASTVETADRFTSLSLTVTNVSDGASEILSFDGSDLALTHGNAVTTATNGLSVSVSVTGSTATVSFTGATLTNAQMQTLIDALTYRNSSETPTTAGNRVVTITGISDNGGIANSGSDSTAPNLTSTVTVSAVNDTPTLSDFGPDAGNVAYVSGSTTFVALDSGTVANLQDIELDTLNSGSGNYNGATMTLVRNGGADITDRFGIAGGTTALDNGSTVTVGATNIGTVTAGSAGTGTITITFNSSATSALVDTFFQSVGYTNSNSSATGTVTIDVTFTDGNTGSQGSGGAESVTQQVNVTIGNAPVIGNLTGDTAAYTESAGEVIIDQGGDVTVTDIDMPANLNGGNLSISVTANANAAQDVLGFSTAGTVALTGTTAGSNVSVGGVVVGTLANSIAAGNTLQVNLNTNATIANVQTLVQAATYNNTSEEPTTGNRTVSFVVTDDSGLSSTAATATVTVASVNDAPTLTATGGNPTYTENGAAQDLFNAVTASTIETADRFTSLSLTVTNVGDGVSEILSFDGSDVALTNGNAVTTATNGLSVSVAVAGSTATVSFTGATLTNAQMQTLVDSLTYRNSSEVPSTANRVVTITSIGDNGGTANSGSDTAAPNLVSTVTVAAVNDQGSFSNLDATPTYIKSTAAIVLDANVTIADLELDDVNSYNGATLQIIRNGGASLNDQFEGSGTLLGVADTETLTEGGALKVGTTTIGTVTTNSNGTLLLTFNASATSTLVDTAIQSIAYSAANTQVAANVQLDWTFSDGTTIAQGSGGAQTAAGSVTVNVSEQPEVTTATYDASSGTLVVTGANIAANGSGSDIDASQLTLTGEGGETYQLTNTADANRDSSTQFTLVLSAADRAALNQILNKDGSSSTDNTNFNLAAADNWATATPAAVDISDATATVTVSGVAAPTITSSTYNAETGVLVITGTNFLKSAGANNDIDASTLSIAGLGGSAYTLTDTADVEISSGTSATITLSATDKAAVNDLVDTEGTSASDSAIYNLAGAEDWAKGADVAVNVADLTGNSITVSSVPATPLPTTQETSPALNLQQQQQPQRDNEPENRPQREVNSGNNGQEDTGNVDSQTTIALIGNEGRGVTSGDILTDPSAGIDALTIIRDTIVGRSASDQNSNRNINSFESTSPSNDAPANGNAGSPPVQLQDVLNVFGPTAGGPNGEQPGNGGDKDVKGDKKDADKQNDPSNKDDEDELNEGNFSPSEEGNRQKTDSEGKDNSSESTDEEPKKGNGNTNSQGAFHQAPRSFSDKLAHANGQTNERVIKALMFKG